jgi:hypothetical protein
MGQHRGSWLCHPMRCPPPTRTSRSGSTSRGFSHSHNDSPINQRLQPLLHKQSDTPHHHHCVVIDADGNRLLSQKIPNDEPALLELSAGVLRLAAGDEVLWPTDLNHGGPALLIAPAPGPRPEPPLHPGPERPLRPRLYRGEGKTDAKDAAVIADQVRMRKDLVPCGQGTRSAPGCGLSFALLSAFHLATPGRSPRSRPAADPCGCIVRTAPPRLARRSRGRVASSRTSSKCR